MQKKDIWNQSTSAIHLQHKMGEMQVDFGAIQFWSKSELVNGFSLNVAFPFSNAGYLQIFRGENLRLKIGATEVTVFRF